MLSGNGIEKLLCVSELENSRGITQAQAIFDALEFWGVKDQVKGVCCDTTPLNLGRSNESAVLLGELLQKNLLYFACRHHIMETVLREIYKTLLPGTTGPNVVLFQRFQTALNINLIL